MFCLTFPPLFKVICKIVLSSRRVPFASFLIPSPLVLMVLTINWWEKKYLLEGSPVHHFQVPMAKQMYCRNNCNVHTVGYF